MAQLPKLLEMMMMKRRGCLQFFFMIPKSENACTRVRDSGWQKLYSQSMSVTCDYYE